MRKIQKAVERLYKARGYRAGLLTLALGLCEEAGEVGKAINTYYNPEYVPSAHNQADTLEHELCDTLVYLLSIANQAGIDLETAMAKRLREEAK